MFKSIKTFYKFFAKRRLIFIVFIVLIIVAAILGNIEPYFFKRFVEAATNFNYQLLTQILLIFIIVKFLSLAIYVLSNWIGDILLINSSVDARVAVFKQLQDLDFYFHTQKSTGALISAIKRGDGAFFSYSHELHFHFLKIIVGFCVMIFFFLRLDVRIVLISVASFLIGLLISKILVSLNMRIRRHFNEEEDNISGIIVDNIVNYDTVKLFAKESWETSRLNKAFVDWKKRIWNYANSFRLIDFSVGTLINTSIFFLLYFCIQLVGKNEIKIGDLVLVITFTNTFYPQMFDLIFSLREIAKNFTDIEKYFVILDQITKIKDPLHPVKLKHVKGKIEFGNVWFSYKGGQKNAVDDVNLTIKQGESIALVGRSGSGKTTMVRLLLRFYDVSKGTIKIDGINIKKFTKSLLRSFTGVVPQEPILFNDTIGYNIGYGKEKTNLKEIKRASSLAHIDEFIEGLPEKYKTLVGERGVKLSGGQKQRVAIARMILSDPDIVIFDEATSQLDSESEKLIQDAFWNVSKGKTTIIIAHRLSTAMRADRIIVMDKGKIVETGSHETLLKNENGLYKKFWNLQTNFD